MKHKEKDVLEKVKCRQIIREILNFGVSQEQIKTLINLLALELEDRELMLKINNFLSVNIEVDDKPQITL